jgi:hypothetical protein
MPNFSCRICCFLFVYFITCTHPLVAGLIDEHSWAEESADGKFILVMTLTEDFISTKERGLHVVCR